LYKKYELEKLKIVPLHAEHTVQVDAEAGAASVYCTVQLHQNDAAPAPQHCIEEHKSKIF
jgi:hypothetical protein